MNIILYMSIEYSLHLSSPQGKPSIAFCPSKKKKTLGLNKLLTKYLQLVTHEENLAMSGLQKLALLNWMLLDFILKEKINSNLMF